MTGASGGTLLALAAAVLLSAAPDAGAQRLGRLFTSPEERANLDELRYQAQIAQPAVEPEPAPVAAAAAAQPEPSGPAISSLTVNGVVRRSGGRGTVWVNGDEIERGGMTREGIQVQSAGPDGRSVRVVLPSGVDTVDIKPGQKIDVIRGVVLEPYEKGAESAGPSAFRGSPPAAPASVESAAAPAEPQVAAPPPAAGGTPSATAAQDALERLRAISRLPAAEQARLLQGVQPGGPAPNAGDAARPR